MLPKALRPVLEQMLPLNPCNQHRTQQPFDGRHEIALALK